MVPPDHARGSSSHGAARSHTAEPYFTGAASINSPRQGALNSGRPRDGGVREGDAHEDGVRELRERVSRSLRSNSAEVVLGTLAELRACPQRLAIGAAAVDELVVHAEGGGRAHRRR